MTNIKLNEPYKGKCLEIINKENLLEIIIKPHYDPRYELERATRNLDWSFNAKEPQTFFKTTSEEEAARLDSWYKSRVGEIAREEQAFRQRLDAARKSRAIDEIDHMKAIMNLESLTSPFERARQEARESYHKIRKFV